MTLHIPLPLERWRLMLGDAAETSCGSLGEQAAAADAALEWLYGRDPERGERDERSGSLGPSSLSTPDWINSIHTLFPKEVIERLETDAVERFGIDEVVTNLDVLGRIAPSESLLRAVLHTKHLMNPEVLAAARCRGGPAHHGTAGHRSAPGVFGHARPAQPQPGENRQQLRLQAHRG
jgi:hypothetical protein